MFVQKHGFKDLSMSVFLSKCYNVISLCLGTIRFGLAHQNCVFLTPLPLVLLLCRVPSKIIEPLTPRDVKYIEHPLPPPPPPPPPPQKN